MSIRLGCVGCGKWARKLAESFRACGAEIVAYDRQAPVRPGFFARNTLGHGPLDYDGTFGVRTPWRDQLADKSIDAIVAVAPPEVTTEVALACAAAGKAVMATKPLFDHPERITAPFYVDFWRLWSEAHQSAKASGDCVSIVLKGAGPHRDFPGMFDYGPHCVAAVLDIAAGRSVRLVDYHRSDCQSGEVYLAQYMIGGELVRGGTLVDIEFGDGATEGIRRVHWHDERAADTVHETPTHIDLEPKEAIMQKFCRSFLSDVSEGFVSTTLLDYSREGMRMLREIREKSRE